MLPMDHVIALSAILFMIGVLGVATRRNIIVMLLNLSTDEFPTGKQRVVKLAVVIAGVAILAQVLIALGQDPLLAAQPAAVPEGFGGYRQVGISLYTDYVLIVEMASLLLLAAIVGALILAKRKID